MADNVTLSTGNNTGAPDATIIASDDVGGVQYQRVKIALGAPNAVDTDLDSGQQTSANSAPVVIASDQSAVAMQGPAAHDAVASGNPVVNGGVAETTRPAAVADGDAVRLWVDELGRLVTMPGSGEDNWAAAEYTTNQTDTQLIAAPGAGLAIRLYELVVSTGTAGTVLFEQGTATRLIGRVSLAANGGFVWSSARGLLLGANTALTVTTTTGAGPLAITISYTVEAG